MRLVILIALTASLLAPSLLGAQPVGAVSVGGERWVAVLSNGDLFEGRPTFCGAYCQPPDTTWSYYGNVFSGAGFPTGVDRVVALLTRSWGSGEIGFVCESGDYFSGGLLAWSFTRNDFDALGIPRQLVVGAAGGTQNFAIVTVDGQVIQDNGGHVAHLGRLFNPTPIESNSWGQIKTRYR